MWRKPVDCTTRSQSAQAKASSRKVCSMNLANHLQLAVGLLVWSIGFYFSHLLLIAISIIPAAIRMAQMLNKKYLTSPLLEAITGLSHVVLVFAIIGVGAQVSSEALFSGQALAILLYNAFVFAKEHWGEILVQSAFFGLLFGLLNLLIAFGIKRVAASDQVERLAGAGGDVSALGEATRFVIKNAIVIPLSLVYLLGMLHAI
jgi:hypothetical protein